MDELFYTDSKYNFIRVVSWWHKHLVVKPKEIGCARDNYCLPKLQIATIEMDFDSNIGKFYGDYEIPME
jgi:hypothetical protein